MYDNKLITPQITIQAPQKLLDPYLQSTYLSNNLRHCLFFIKEYYNRSKKLKSITEKCDRRVASLRSLMWRVPNFGENC